ncbi:MAG TPA: zf-HC2 domain-containing protein [Pyrinomonadaceae bacterium]|jgi:anti-sigma factor RsiW
MKEKMLSEKKMQDTVTGGEACARAEDLIAYLYGEANGGDALEFETHTRHCAACRAELAEFGQVRQSIGDWRAEMLGSLASVQAETGIAHGLERVDLTSAHQRSALAAIREFFRLSPGWMRAATAFASIIICALLVFAVARFFERSQPSANLVQNNPQTSEKVYTQKELEAIVAQQLEEERNRIKSISAGQQESRGVTPALVQNNQARGPLVISQSVRRAPSAGANVIAANSSRQRTGSGRLTRKERQEIAEFILAQGTLSNEDNVPRLSDLLDDSNESN